MKSISPLISALLCTMFCAIATTSTSGCARADEDRSAAVARRRENSKTETFDAVMAIDSNHFVSAMGPDGDVAPQGDTGPNADDLNEPGANRKIIHTAKLAMLVPSIEEFASAVEQLTHEHHGYIAKFDEDRAAGSTPTATWTLRVDVKSFQTVMRALAELGVAESREVDTEDVSEQYVDLEAQLRNRRRLESEILNLLDARESRLEEILTIKHELTTVREEIERIEGRVRFLAARVELATISLQARQEEDYTPTPPVTFTARVSEAWEASSDRMQTAGQNTVLLAINSVPWLALVCLIAPVAIVTWRRRRTA